MTLKEVRMSHPTDTPATDGAEEVAAARTDEELSTEELNQISAAGKSGAPGSSHTYHNSYSGSSSNKS